MSRMLKVLMWLVVGLLLLLAFFFVVGVATGNRAPDKLATITDVYCPFKVTVPRTWWVMPQPNPLSILVPHGVQSNPAVELHLYEQHNLSKTPKSEGFLHNFSKVCTFEDRGSLFTDSSKKAEKVYGQCGSDANPNERTYVYLALIEERVASNFVLVQSADKSKVNDNIKVVDAIAKSYEQFGGCADRRN